MNVWWGPGLFRPLNNNYFFSNFKDLKKSHQQVRRQNASRTWSWGNPDKWRPRSDRPQSLHVSTQENYSLLPTPYYGCYLSNQGLPYHWCKNTAVGKIFNPMAVYFFKRSAFIFFSNFKYAFLKVNYPSQFGRKVLLIDFWESFIVNSMGRRHL